MKLYMAGGGLDRRWAGLDWYTPPYTDKWCGHCQLDTRKLFEEVTQLPTTILRKQRLRRERRWKDTQIERMAADPKEGDFWQVKIFVGNNAQL